MSATDPRSVTFPRARVVRAHTLLLLHRFFRGGADARRGDDDMGGVKLTRLCFGVRVDGVGRTLSLKA